MQIQQTQMVATFNHVIFNSIAAAKAFKKELLNYSDIYGIEVDNTKVTYHLFSPSHGAALAEDFAIRWKAKLDENSKVVETSSDSTTKD